MKFPVLSFTLLLTCTPPLHAEPMTFRYATTGGLCVGCTWIDATGEITAETPAAFEAFIETRDFQGDLPYPVLLNSKGGDLGAALALGRRFRELDASVGIARTTYEQEADAAVPSLEEEGVCHSACAYAFIGGQTRSLEHGTLGFHQFFDDDILASRNENAFSTVDRLRDHYVVGVLITYLIEMGIDAGFFALYAATPPETMRIITPSEASDWGLVTNDKALKEWEMLPLGQGLMLQAESFDKSEGLRLFCLRRKPDRMHLQFLFRTEDGQPRLVNKDASGSAEEIAELLPKTTARAGQDPLKLKFERLYDDTAYGFDLNFDFTFPTAQLASFHDAEYASLSPSEDLRGYLNGVAVMTFFSRQLPPIGPKALFTIAARNCA